MLKKIFNKYSLIFFLCSFLATPNVKSIEENKSNKINSSEIIQLKENDKNNSPYILGPGDQIYIIFRGLKNYSSLYTIDSDGSLDLPDLNFINAKDSTISELTKTLTRKYSDFIYDPKIKIKLFKPRPIKVTLRGEVNTTGLYNFKFKKAKHVTQPESFNLPKETPYEFNQNASRDFYSTSYDFPTLFDLLRKARGLTSYADLSKITVIRKNSQSRGGGKIKAEINFLEFFYKGNQEVNIQLRDGDDIFVSRSEKILIDQLNTINASNMSPENITVFINGNVIDKGSITLPQGISLNEAIAAAGSKSLSGNIEFIRLRDRGISEKKIIAFNNKSEKGSSNNPILLKGDIIYVRKNLLGKTTQAIREYSSPLFTSYGIYKIFD